MIAKIGGGQFKNLSVVENVIWNHCARLIANCIIYYNSVILNKTLELLVLAGGEDHIIEDIAYISPIAWEHINMVGRYEFIGQTPPIDIEKIAEKISSIFCNKNHLSS